ncbi:hypothetical protein [Flavihumibacter fluvii]|uniref:hypothetical protein n=1 Tax=Flavihumibacter fluvii TaxID=2838157 RepID=UPI001BDE67E8|nr:hypothetical protein [Flavihumibacter fluvii]ULQ53967.1 hypothetical protein KJS93_06500 [Flavihumibacter fluvii]
MKKFLLTTLLASSILAVSAQSLEKAKDLLKSKKLGDAKTQIDQFLAVEKNAKNGEGWYTKAKIYSEIAQDAALAAANPNARWTAFEALKQYVTLDEKGQLVLMQLDNYKPIMDIYQGYFKAGAEEYNSNKFEPAFEDFKNCLAVSEYMTSKKWSTISLDTTVILYAGISAEKSNKRDEAAIYYGKLAEAKVTGEGMVEIYKWLVDHYYNQKKDEASANKYLALGKEVFPKDQFWAIYELDMARDKGDKAELYKKYEAVLAADPANTSVRYNYAVEMYQEAYKPDIAQRPANSAEMVVKVDENLKKVIAEKPDYAAAYLVLGQIQYNQGVDYNNQNKAIRPPQGGKLKPEELKKKEELRGLITQKFDAAIPYFEKVDEILGNKGKLKMDEKGYLKDAYDLLITIYDNKGNKEKLKVYEEKFNNVDKAH